jgi:hypothetical protein
MNSEDVDQRVLRYASVRDVHQSPHACITRGRAEILVRAEVDPRRAGRALAHVVVRRRDNLIDAAARFCELGKIAEIDGSYLGVRRKRGERLTVAGERADLGARSQQTADDGASELSRGADDKYPRFAHRASRL